MLKFALHPYFYSWQEILKSNDQMPWSQFLVIPWWFLMCNHQANFLWMQWKMLKYSQKDLCLIWPPSSPWHTLEPNYQHCTQDNYWLVFHENGCGHSNYPEDELSWLSWPTDLSFGTSVTLKFQRYTHFHRKCIEILIILYLNLPFEPFVLQIIMSNATSMSHCLLSWFLCFKDLLKNSHVTYKAPLERHVKTANGAVSKKQLKRPILMASSAFSSLCVYL